MPGAALVVTALRPLGNVTAVNDRLAGQARGEFVLGAAVFVTALYPLGHVNAVNGRLA